MTAGLLVGLWEQVLHNSYQLIRIESNTHLDLIEKTL